MKGRRTCFPSGGSTWRREMEHPESEVGGGPVCGNPVRTCGAPLRQDAAVPGRCRLSSGASFHLHAQPPAWPGPRTPAHCAGLLSGQVARLPSSEWACTWQLHSGRADSAGRWPSAGRPPCPVAPALRLGFLCSPTTPMCPGPGTEAQCFLLPNASTEPTPRKRSVNF